MIGVGGPSGLGRLPLSQEQEGRFVRPVLSLNGSAISADCIAVVDPEQQYLHLEQVIGLHDSLYSRPFSMPPLPLPASAQTHTQSWDQSADTTFASLDSTIPSSEIGSEASVDFEQVKVCFIRHSCKDVEKRC